MPNSPADLDAIRLKYGIPDDGDPAILMRIIVEAVTGKVAESAMLRIRRQVFEREMGLKLPRLGMQDDGAGLHLLAFAEPSPDPVATLSVVETSGDQDLLGRYDLWIDPEALSARYTQLAVLKEYRGVSIPLMMIVEAQRMFVEPRQIEFTWLLYDAQRAASSSMCKLLGFRPGNRVLESEYGTTRALVRNEMAPGAREANRAASEFLSKLAKCVLPAGARQDSAMAPVEALEAR